MVERLDNNINNSAVILCGFISSFLLSFFINRLEPNRRAWRFIAKRDEGSFFTN